MDAEHANHDRGRRTEFSALWRSFPWWERVVYVLAVLLFLPVFCLEVLTEHLQAQWHGQVHWILIQRLLQIDLLLLTACAPFLVAAGMLAMRRWRPETWRDVRRLWSLRAVLVGLGVLLAVSAWDTVVELATPPDQLPPNLPSFPDVLAIAAGGLVLVGGMLGVPEVIVRLSRAQRQQL
jgi:hypothetical protein